MYQAAEIANPSFEPNVGGYTRENRTDTNANQDLAGVPMRYFERFLEVLFLQILFKDTGVEVVVHLVIEPGQRPRFNGLEAFRGHRLAVGRL